MLTEVSLQIYVHLGGANAQKKVPKNPIFFKVATAPQSTEKSKFWYKGTEKKNLYYSFDCDGNLHTYVKSKIKWGNYLELFSIFFIENELFTENVKRGDRAV